jgi:hypothetical protein
VTPKATKRAPKTAWMDGNQLLRDVLEQSTYGSAAGAVAALTLFSHPVTVKQTGNRNLFRVVRRKSQTEIGKVHDASDGMGAMWDDNSAPTHAFRWSNGLRSAGSRDVQFNHVYDRVSGDDVCAGYTALANLCVTPAFLAKLTDTDPEIRALLRYRVFDLYGYAPEGAPIRPDGYERLTWRDCLPPIADLVATLRLALQKSRKSRTAHSVREIGWLFSNFCPDLSTSDAFSAPPRPKITSRGSDSTAMAPALIISGDTQYPAADHHQLVERVADLPANAAKWVGNAATGVDYHGPVSLQKDPFHLHLLWKSADGERCTEVGRYRISLSTLLRDGFVRPVAGGRVRLRFVRAADGTIQIQLNNSSPALPVGTAEL